MKKQLFSLALLLSLSASFSGTSFAADLGKRDGREQRKDFGKGQRSDELAKELGLNAKQKAKVEKIFQEQQQQMQALRSRSGSADRSQSMSEVKRIHDNSDKKLKDVLSKKQYAQFEAKRQERQRQMSQQGNRRDDDQRGNGRRDDDRRTDDRRDVGGRSRS
ncbi:hypothetical protein [Hymenobacter sediminicola]|uniref:DUF4890 domain-containing protein n=1 Tax=Hymenobacter sediminicola TaxID=2761579 RepID=A0A7G7W8M4_9BACT|nr:hypothetical protein [Hymenobacter sediminicola]QNH62717.1 hypothetical protein H4317_02510 [Hymenobacter sediminicola]